MSANQNPKNNLTFDVSKVAEDLAEEEAALADALVEIARVYGKFNEDETGIWAGYESAEDNEVKEGNGVCKIIAQQVEDDGMCRFAVIPDGLVMPEADEEDDMEDEMGKSVGSELVDEVIKNLL